MSIIKEKTITNSFLKQIKFETFEKVRCFEKNIG